LTAAPQEPRTCIFLNCGATLNIRDLVDLGDSIRAVVIDSHRPIHHSYNDDEDKMACAVIAKDDYVSKGEIPGSDRQFEHLGERRQQRQRPLGLALAAAQGPGPPCRGDCHGVAARRGLRLLPAGEAAAAPGNAAQAQAPRATRPPCRVRQR
jgi:hypothetical protein